MITWFDMIVYALGWFVLICLSWKIGKAIPRFAVALARACSVCRWTFASGRVHGFKRRTGLAWLSLLYWSFVDGLDKLPPKYSCRHGVWTDIGNWTVFPSKAKP